MLGPISTTVCAISLEYAYSALIFHCALGPAQIFICVPTWPGHFDIEIDCIAAV
jgi:hypothetical protein